MKLLSSIRVISYKKRKTQSSMTIYSLTYYHLLSQEDSISLLTVIKGTGKYRRSWRYDLVSDFLPPSKGELAYALDEVLG